MADFVVKSMDSPDELRTPRLTTVQVVHLGGMTLGRTTFQPGWRWSECVKPVVGTDRCQVNHVGYAVSGTLGAELEGGTTVTIHAGDAYHIPPGHEAWVEGNEPFVGIEASGAAEYAKPS